MPVMQAAKIDRKWHFPSKHTAGQTVCGLSGGKWETIGSNHRLVNVEDACTECFKWRGEHEDDRQSTLMNELHQIISLYVKGELPENIKVYAVRYRKGPKGEIILLSDTPEWIEPRVKPLPPKSYNEKITLEEIMIDGQVIVAGYGPLFRTLMIGQEE